MLGERRVIGNGASRAVVLEGAFNVRDLGGFAGLDGRIVRRGQVFRSAALSSLTEADVATLSALGLKLVVDLRSTGERLHRPSRLPTETWARDYDNSDADLVRALREPGVTALEVRERMATAYADLIDEQAVSFAMLFQRIAGGAVPILFHCAAGKDRTGIAAALLLTLLGVSRTDVEADYLQSLDAVGRILDDARAALSVSGVPDIDEAVLAPVLGVERGYLDTLFDTVGRRFGSVEGYVEERLGLSVNDVEAIRRRLLDPSGGLND
jgi:protein-tyrosine phosphatase